MSDVVVNRPGRRSVVDPAEQNPRGPMVVGRDVDVAGVLRQARAHRGLSQRELEALTGVRQSSIAEYESGGMRPGLVVLLRLLRGLRYRMVFLPEGDRR